VSSCKLVVILPCYNEEEVLPSSIAQLNTLFDGLTAQGVISADSQLCFVDDGSSDETWTSISKNSNARIKGIKLSRNFGHQFALLAGLEQLCGHFDAYVTIDADLQDDINAIEEMVLHFSAGNQIVYGVRDDRKSDSFFKRRTAEGFYKLMNKLGVETVYNHADFRLVGNAALNSFLEFKERNLFIRGIFPRLGYKTAQVFYKRTERTAGETKYPLRKMMAFAWEGVSSFSVKPLRMILTIGLLCFLVSLSLIGWAIFAYFSGAHLEDGWLSTIIPTTFLGGIQMISIGVIGEYIGKLYTEAKARPRYIIEKDI
jgi:glycosyltransferase involved in cell wall biosynthesis